MTREPMQAQQSQPHAIIAAAPHDYDHDDDLGFGEPLALQPEAAANSRAPRRRPSRTPHGSHCSGAR